MKTLRYIAMLAATALTSFGCQDFLELRPEGSTLAEGTDYTVPENTFLSVSAAYAALRSGNAHGFGYIGLFEIASDNADKGSAPDDSPTMKEIDQLTFTETNENINNVWIGYYDAVSAANYAIHQMPVFVENLAKAEDRAYALECQAEARFLRAYAYFNLVRTFGRVPIIDTILTSSQLSAVKQSTAEEVYDFIDKDLEAAVAGMPATYSKEWSGRATKYTAMALKSKVALYRGNYNEAAEMADGVIASNRYSLMSDFAEVFSMDGENCRESLFEIQSSTFGQITGETTYLEYAYYQGPRGNSPSNMQGWGFCTPSDNLIKFFTDRGDTERAAATLLYRGTLTAEGDSIKMACANKVYNGKVYTPSSYNKWNYNGYGFDHNVRILRYAEVLLIYAEAYARGADHVSTSGLTAYDALNLVRGRVKLPAVPATLDNILDERRAELAMEEDRYFDLIRTGLAKTALAADGKTFVEGRHEHYPIPSNQMQTNLNLTQNDGYTL